jgi:hypothetical protein
MHISLDSALGQQRRLNQVGESITQIAPDPAAAYSLRSLTGGDPKVVRVRRASDNHEQDFTASDVSSGALQDFVNAQVVAPLDIQALSATGRDGDFLIAKAAYSLRSLGTRQATVTSSGDTDGDTSGKFVCQVRKDQTSTSDDTKSFTATEVSDGTLVDFVLGNTKSLLNSRAYFDGSDDNVKLTSEINLTGDFSLEYSFVVTVANQQIIGKETGGSYIRAGGSDGIQNFRVQTDGSASTLSLTSNLKYGVANTVKLKRVSGKFGIYNESDVLISAEFTNSDTFTINSFGRGRGTRAIGVVYNIRIDTNNDGTINHSYNGYGNTLSDWTDLVGSNNASAVNGSPALFTGQDQDGFVKTWYDQSVTTQAGDTATGNHATQATAANQPKIVDAGTLLNELDFDGTEDMALATGSFSLTQAYTTFSVSHTDDASTSQGVWSTASSITGAFNAVSLFRNDDGFAVNSGTTITTAGTIDYVADRTYLQTNVVNGASSSIFVDGATGVTGNAGSNNPSGILILGFYRVSSANANLDGGIKELIIYDSDQTDNRTAIEANIGEAYSIDLPSGVDPGFDQVDGFVETWYDQSGNGKDATQATAGSQPKIVNAGALVVDSGIGGLDFDGDDFLTASSVSGLEGSISMFAVSVRDATGYVVSPSNSSAANRYFGIQEAASTVVANPRNTSNKTVSDSVSGNDRLTFVVTTGATSTSVGANGSAVTTTTDDYGDDFAGSNLDQIAIGVLRTVSASGQFNGRIREILVYSSDQTDNRTALETNINGHYSIF